MSPTITSLGTVAGVILGTAAYMSPEQARGKTVDKRTDIWAFGVVLYEMLSGRRAFGGDDTSEVLASVLKDTPDLDALPATTPSRLKRLIERCLDGDLKTRLRTSARRDPTLHRAPRTDGSTRVRMEGWRKGMTAPDGRHVGLDRD